MALVEADIPKVAKRAAEIYRADAALLNRYHGGYPIALLLVRETLESDGRMGSVGDAGLGEFGVFQLAAHTETEFGVPAGTRKSRDGNFFLAGCEYNTDAIRVVTRYPGLVVNLDDLYLFATLPFVIGWGGAEWILSRLPRPLTYAGAVAWTKQQLAAGRLPQLGSQSPTKIAYRVGAIGIMGRVASTLQTQYGVSDQASAPILPPKPSWLTRFKIPSDVAGKIKQQTGGEQPYTPRASDLALWKSPTKYGKAVVLSAIGLGLVGLGIGAWRSGSRRGVL